MTERGRELEEFRRLADLWGARLDRWPEARRAWAGRLATTPEAAAILATQAQLDARIEAHPQVSEARAAAVVGAVMGRVAQEAAQREAANADGWWPPLAAWLFAPGGAVAVVAAAGVAAGVVVGALLGAAAPLGGAAEQDLARYLIVGRLDLSEVGIL